MYRVLLRVIPLLVAACTGAGTSPEVGAEPGRTVRSLWEDPPVVGASVLVREAVITSGRGADGLTVYAQQPETTLGLEIRAAASLHGWPPPVGTPVSFRAIYEGPPTAPRVWLQDVDSVEVLGELAEPTVRDEPTGAPPPFTLARWSGIVIETRADPTGRLNTSGFRMESRFGVRAPGPGSVGVVTGLVTERETVTLRTEEDWQGTREPLVVVDATVADILDGKVPEGTWVRLEATQATPWSRGGRLTLLQDEARGLWVDTEGFDVGPGEVGERGVWVGEAIRGGDFWYLRTWVPREVVGVGIPAISEELVHGAIVQRQVLSLLPPNPLGERAADGDTLLDDRFIDLSGLPEDVEVTAAVDLSSGLSLAVIRAEALAP